jgi:uncharacterized Fe-S cluster-containing radical SAM superfamily protein
MRGLLNEFFKNDENVSIELFSAGWCNLNCKYCYIPKGDYTKDVHAKVLKRIKDGSLITEMKELFGTTLTRISHWGTEPTLTVTQFGDFYKQVVEEFPNFEGIMLSSNFMTNPQNIITFIRDIFPRTKPLEIKVQISIDGPSWLTDNNRTGGSTELIIKNATAFLQAIKEMDTPHTVLTNVKSTMSAEGMNILSDLEKCREYYQFFDDLLRSWEPLARKGLVIPNMINPTIVVPYAYTKQDGINFDKVFVNQLALDGEYEFAKPYCYYDGMFRKRMVTSQEYFVKARMFLCSAGRNSHALTETPGKLATCHRGFYMDSQEYYDALGNSPDEITKEGLDAKRTQLLGEKVMCDYTDRKERVKFVYRNRMIHDFAKMQSTYGVSLSRELAEAGQISACYKDPRWAQLLHMMTQLPRCHLDDVVISGSGLVQGSFYYRLFGNGFVERIIERYVNGLQ